LSVVASHTEVGSAGRPHRQPAAPTGPLNRSGTGSV